MFKDKDFTENIIYEKLLNDTLNTNLGYLYENIVAQILVMAMNYFIIPFSMKLRGIIMKLIFFLQVEIKYVRLK